MIWPFSLRRRANNWMMTSTGVRYWPTCPSAHDVRIMDIAHHLSRICRYTGAIIPEHYSVAEHSVLVSHMVPPVWAFEGLMHDATEAYCNDLSRPMKTDLPDYRRIERRNWLVICEKFGMDPELPPCVHEADVRVYLAEREQIMPPITQEDGYSLHYKPAPVVIHAFAPNRAKRLFLDRYYELTSGHGYARRCGTPADGSPPTREEAWCAA
jgi:hypothetical protein